MPLDWVVWMENGMRWIILVVFATAISSAGVYADAKSDLFKAASDGDLGRYDRRWNRELT